MAALRIVTITAVGGVNGTTSADYDTTGANLISLAVSSLNAVADATISDTYSNTWVARTRQGNANAYLTIYDCTNPTVGTGHHFAALVTGGHSSIAGFAYSGAGGGFDQQNTNFDNSGSATFLNTGSVTPGVTGEVLVAALCFGQPDSNPTIDSSFASPGVVYINQTTNNQGLAMSDLIETSIVTKNPYWSFGAVYYLCANIATYKPGGAAVIENLGWNKTQTFLESERGILGRF